MKVTKTDFEIIKCLIFEKNLKRGAKFTKKKIIQNLKLNGSIEVKRLTSQRYSITLLKEDNIFNFLKSIDYNIANVKDIDSYMDEVLTKNSSRDKIQKWTKGTKVESSQSLKGLYISSLKNIDIKINDQIVTIVPVNGLGYFCFYTEKIEVSIKTIIVGVENYQVIWFAKKYREFFERENILFVIRNPYMLEWIGTLENEYIHFGDYDLAGINIYINEILPRLQQCKKYSMFIPDNIEYLLKNHGNIELFEKQKRYENLIIEDNEVNSLKNLILKYKKGLEQEGLYLFKN